MITIEFAKQFSENWTKDWNSHNLEKILSHYSDDFSIESPLALKRLPETKGIVIGKDNVRKYWTIGLESNPNLHFKIIDLLIGVNSITIYYLNTTTGKRSTELMTFDSNKKVIKAIVNYSE
ncbi:YybH family protein [Maribacter sp. IgM3_T14_3]|uniref:YybH family protein n=1 Tax=Maribacter sp. IgM3_T14_3 TaxID=3415140 RepID=UPI003C70221C